MAKRASTEDKLTILKKLAREPIGKDSRKAIVSALTGTNNILAAKAAELVGKLGLEELIPDLLKAFERFSDNPLKKDKGCLAKEAIIEALDSLEYDDEAIFLQGISYFQVEPAYLRPVDTAAMLRGKCAFALVRIGSSHIVFELVELLTDPERQARIAAVKALTGISSDISEPLLRLKIKQGNEDQQVLAECLYALMKVNPENSIGFLERFLDTDDLPELDNRALILAENAALAIGESKLEKALEILQRHREESLNPEFQNMLLVPIALTRLEGAFDYLIDIIGKGNLQSAVSAVNALKIFCDESHQSKIQMAVISRNEPEVSEAYAAWNAE